MSGTASTLILVPTALERSVLEEEGGLPTAPALCGFGPISAAARTAQLLHEQRPARVLLLGVAGSLARERAEPGQALDFAWVRLDGVGAGSGPDFLPPSRLGFPQWQGANERIEETLALRAHGTAELLTVCSASATPAEAGARRARYPAAVAEDMEGFGVALACRLAGVALTIVRGISNVAGERDRRRWNVRAALRTARQRALECLEQAGREA